jgi:hypothetical protein
MTPPEVAAGALLPALRRPVAALALLLLWLNVEVQAQRALPEPDLRVLAARLLLCYVAVFWLRLAWSALTARRRPSGPPASGLTPTPSRSTPPPPSPPPSPSAAPAPAGP